MRWLPRLWVVLAGDLFTGPGFGVGVGWGGLVGVGLSAGLCPGGGPAACLPSLPLAPHQ